MKNDPIEETTLPEEKATAPKPKKKSAKKAKKTPVSMAEGLEAWVRMRKKPSAQESILSSILEEVAEWEANGADNASKGSLSNAALQALEFALADGSPEQDN